VRLSYVISKIQSDFLQSNRLERQTVFFFQSGAKEKKDSLPFQSSASKNKLNLSNSKWKTHSTSLLKNFLCLKYLFSTDFSMQKNKLWIYSIFADSQNFSTKFHFKKPFRFRKFFARKLICRTFQFSLIFNFLLTNSVFKNLFVSANFLPENWFAELSSFHWFSFFYLQIPFLKTFSFP